MESKGVYHHEKPKRDESTRKKTENEIKQDRTKRRLIKNSKRSQSQKFMVEREYSSENDEKNNYPFKHDQKNQSTLKSECKENKPKRFQSRKHEEDENDTEKEVNKLLFYCS